MKQRVVTHPLMTPDPSRRSLHLDQYEGGYDDVDDSYYENIPEARLANSPAPSATAPSSSSSSSSAKKKVDELKLKYQSEMQFLRGLAPHSTEESLWELFVTHQYQVDATIDAVLAEAVVMEETQGAINSQKKTQSSTAENNSSSGASHSYPAMLEERASEAAMKASLLSDLRKGQSIQSIMMDIESRKANQRASNHRYGKISTIQLMEDMHRTYRGTNMPLPRSFLKVPQYRLILNELCNGHVDFTICFYRNFDKLGITVKEVNAEIVVTCLHLTDRGETMMAERAGVQVDDILLGINGEMFSPWPELQDVIELLSVSGPFVVIHLRRKLPMHRVDINDMHSAMRLFLEQRVITKGKAEVVDRLLSSFKHRVVEWNDSTISDRIENWRLDLLDSSLSSMLSSSLSSREGVSSSSSTSSNSDRRRSLGNIGRSHSEKQRRRMTLSAATLPLGLHPTPQQMPFYHTKHLRPALSVRILRAEPSKNGDHTEYVIWVNDIKSGIEWIVRRRFREFFDFREVLVQIRPSLKCLDFPPKRLTGESATLIQERIPILQKFLRNLCGVITMNEYHPSTIKIQLALQRFLAVDERIHSMILQDSDIQFFTTLSRHVQIYIHSIMHMSVMDKVIYGFVDTFMANQVDDVSKSWNEEECDAICEELKLFLDHVQNFLFDCFYEDCLEIINQHKQLTQIFASQTSQLLRKLKACNNSNGDANGSGSGGIGSGLERESSLDALPALLVSSTAGKSSIAGGPTTGNSAGTGSNAVSAVIDGTEYTPQQLCDMVLLVNQDELRSVIRSAMRKQVEIDIYLGCVGRVAYIMHETLKTVSQQFHTKISKLLPYPQSYYGIPVQHISPSSWGEVVTGFRSIMNYTLPYDKIEAILQVSKQLLALFQQEHPNAEKPIGADELLPIFIYIVVQAQLPNLVIINHELQTLCDQDRVMSETGYYLATLQASISHILDADLDKPRLFSY